jgi:hypothetical protein
MTFADVEAAAKELGEQAGKGKDTQIKMLLKVVNGAFHGSVDLQENKHATDVDDCTKLAETYVTAQSSSVVFDAKAPNQRKLISTFRTCTKLGQWTKGGNGEPLATVNELITMRQKLRAIPGEIKKLDDAANTLLRYARAQLKRDQLIDDKELKTFCYKKDSTLQTPEQIIEGCRKQLLALKDGKAAFGTAQDASQEIRDAIKNLTERLKKIADKRGAAKAQVAAAEDAKDIKAGEELSMSATFAGYTEEQLLGSLEALNPAANFVAAVGEPAAAHYNEFVELAKELPKV